MSTSLRVIIDGRALVGRRTGIGVHTAEIASRLETEPAPLIASHRAIDDRSSIERCRFRVDAIAPGVVWQQTRLARVAKEEGDVLWGPHGTLPLNLRTPSVITIHDLTALTMPLKHKIKTLASFNLLIGRSVANASRIAAVSQATADELMRGFGVPSSRITIVPNGVDSFYSPSNALPEVMPFDLEHERFVLYVGTVEPRKGVADLISAWTTLPTPRPRLVICGSLGWSYRAVLKMVEEHPDRHDIIVSGYLDQTSIRDLYRHCMMFVYPSHYEGFGLPPLEAMACGAPVVTTRAGALPEVVGDAAVMVEAGAINELGAAMRRLAVNETQRREMKQRGIERAAKFEWGTSAARMIEMLAGAASTK
jgi:glycosyltransferase involved in cell wall biosynthesis